MPSSAVAGKGPEDDRGGKGQRPQRHLGTRRLPGRPWDTRLNGEAGGLCGGRGYNGGGWEGGGEGGNEKLTGGRGREVY